MQILHIPLLSIIHLHGICWQYAGSFGVWEDEGGVLSALMCFSRKERKVRKGVGAGLVCLADLTLLILIDPKLALTDSN